MERGRLIVYLGAAPGVGKTYRMLDEGQRRRHRGTDVVIGVVQTYGRASTAQMAEGLEVVPAQALEYGGVTYQEMDVDAILQRHPQVALVDEFAHTNAPGARNGKRWRDVEDLLEAGIVVVTTVDISHLESLSDVVESITGIELKESRPAGCARKSPAERGPYKPEQDLPSRINGMVVQSSAACAHPGWIFGLRAQMKPQVQAAATNAINTASSPARRTMSSLRRVSRSVAPAGTVSRR